MTIKTNYKVLAPILLIIAAIIITTLLLTNFNLISNAIIVIITGIAGGKTYSSICNFEGKLRHAKVSE